MIKRQNSDGLVLVMMLIIISALMLIGITLIRQSAVQYSVNTRIATASNTIYTAEAGIERSVQALNSDNTFTGYSSKQTFFDNKNQGYGTYTTSITQAPGNTNAKVITSTGNIYNFYQRTKLVSARTVQVTVVGTGSEGYSVVSGPGGLILGGSANITNSSVYVGGTITLTGAAKIGTATKPLTVDVANKSCPTTGGASYPSTCTSTEPISMAYSTGIYGSVCATGQTSKGPNNNIQTGNGGQGLIVGCTAPAVTQPGYDRAAHIAGMTTVATATDNTYVCNSSPFTRVWPAGLRLNGNVVIGTSCKVTIKGNVYISGTLTFNGAATMTVDDSVGTTRPVIVADGNITVEGSAAVLSNSSGTGLQFISFASKASCGATCTTMSGSDLKNSASNLTVSVGGAASVPGVIFQAYWGKITVGGSGTIGAAVGQTVDLSGAGTVTFGTKLSTGVSTWTISSYQIKYPGQ